ncbi:MAG: hypothetical protein WC943_09520 [Elusimicrobiota bacterium]|jgi:hypothetical protein
MMNLLLGALLALAPHASAGTFPRTLDSLFDGTAKVEPNVIPRFKPKKVALPPEKPIAEFIPVAIELPVLPVSDFDRQAMVLGAGLKALTAVHGFVQDMSSEPSIVEPLDPEARPSSPGPRPLVFKVHGFVPGDRFESLAADKTVLKVSKDPSAEPLSEDRLAVLRFLASRLERMLSVPGVAAAGLGWDCMVKGEHLHILPHNPAVAVETSPSADPAAVRASLLEALPELSELILEVVVQRNTPAGF